MYIDISSLVAYYLPEKKSSFVQEIIKSATRVHISLIIDIEMLSAIRKKQRTKEIRPGHAESAYKLFKTHRESGLFKVLELTPSVFKSAEFILQNSSASLRTLDAIHLGCVYEYKLELFTFDQILLKAAGEFNLQTIHLTP